MQYMPDPTPANYLPDRTYFWNVLNTVKTEYMKNILTHANEQRMVAKDHKSKMESIAITDTWW